MEMPHVSKRWKMRLGISVLLIILSLLGMIVTDFKPESALKYWNIMIPVFAILCLWLSKIDYQDNRRLSGITLWHEFLHWLATLVVVYMIAAFVHVGIVSNVTAGLFVLMMLALSIFLAGIYIDYTFLIIGALLGAFSVAAVFFIRVLMIVTIPLCIAIIILLFYLHWRKSKTDESDETE